MTLYTDRLKEAKVKVLNKYLHLNGATVTKKDILSDTSLFNKFIVDPNNRHYALTEMAKDELSKMADKRLKEMEEEYHKIGHHKNPQVDAMTLHQQLRDEGYIE